MIKTRKGSALLIAILLMSVLILITIGLSRLVSSETRQIAEMIRNGSAEYLAEGGTELGQLIFFNIEEGNESLFDGKYTLDLSPDINQQGPNQVIQFALQGTTNHIPIRPSTLFQAYQETPTQQIKQQLFQALLPGESTEIFLNDATKNQGFEIQYYVPNINSDLLGETFSQSDLDVLLFKLSGEQQNSTDSYQIDFITEYFPAGGNNPRNNGRSESTPALITTNTTGYNTGTFFKYSGQESNQITEPEIICNEAEICSIDFKQTENIKMNFNEFLSSHNKNAISLTNGINLDLVRAPTGVNDLSQINRIKEEAASIYFRVCSPTCLIAETPSQILEQEQKTLVSPFVLIQSQGTFASTTKNLNTQLTRPNALSVFNFAIYRTEN